MSSFIQPKSLAEALEARLHHPDYVLVAGGTDLWVASKDRRAPAGIVDIFGLPELCGIVKLKEGGLRIGPCTTYASLLSDNNIEKDYSVLHAACRDVGAAQIQARGTIGGNIATSSPVGDSLPPLLALGAEIEVSSLEGKRKIAYQEFHTGYRKVDLAPSELITAILIPAQNASALQFWRKVGTRRAQSISKVMLAGVGHMDANTVGNIKLAFGAVADRSIRALKTESMLLGKEISGETIEEARRTLRAEIHPIDDLRSTSSYRMIVAENLLARFLNNLAMHNSRK